MTLRYRSARPLTVVLQIIASMFALVLTVPCIIILIFLSWHPTRDFTPPDWIKAEGRIMTMKMKARPAPGNCRCLPRWGSIHA